MDGPAMAEKSARQPKKRIPSQPDVERWPLPSGARFASIQRPCDACRAHWSTRDLIRVVDGESQPHRHRVYPAIRLDMPRYTLRIPGEDDVTFRTLAEFLDAVADGYTGQWDIWPILPAAKELWICGDCWTRAQSVGLEKLLNEKEDEQFFDEMRNGDCSSLRGALDRIRAYGAAPGKREI